MATDAMRQQTVPRARRANPASDRIFFSGMILLLWATVLWGFARRTSWPAWCMRRCPTR